MNKPTKEEIYELFESGDKPTSEDFKKLIDATYNEEILVPSTSHIETKESDVMFFMSFGYLKEDTGERDPSGTSWFTSFERIINDGTNVYKFTHPNTTREQPQITVLGYKGNSVVYNKTHRVGETFVIDRTVESFAFNYAVGSTPKPSTNNKTFDDAFDSSQTKLVKMVNVAVKSDENVTLDYRLDSIDAAIRELNILLLKTP